MLLCAHVAEVLPIAASLATCSDKHFTYIAQIIAKDVSGMTVLFLGKLKAKCFRQWGKLWMQSFIYMPRMIVFVKIKNPR